MLKRRDDLFINVRLDDKTIDDRFKRMVFFFVDFQVVSQVAEFSVDSGSAVTIDANLFEKILVVLTVYFVDRRMHFDLRTNGKRKHVFGHLVGGANRNGFFANRTVWRSNRCV